MFSNECIFLAERKVNKHVVNIQRSENPHGTKEVSRLSGKGIGWCARSIVCVMGPIQFDELTVTGESYFNLLMTCLLPVIPNFSPTSVKPDKDAAVH